MMFDNANTDVAYVSEADINKWKESILNEMNEIHNKEKQYKDAIDRVSLDPEPFKLEQQYAYLYKNALNFVFKFDNDDTNMPEYIINTNRKNAENSAKIYNAAIASTIFDIRNGVEERMLRLNKGLEQLKDQEKKLKYELSLVPTSSTDVGNNIYTFIQDTINNISDDFAENYISIIYTEIMDKQDEDNYEATISSSVNQYASKTMLKKIRENVIKHYEKAMINFAREYFRIRDADIYTKQNEIRKIIHDFELKFKSGIQDWLLYCTNSDTIPKFSSSAVAKSMTMARMQSYNQRVETSETLFMMKYLRNVNELLSISTWFNEEELKNESKHESKHESIKPVIKVEEVGEEAKVENEVEASDKPTLENFVDTIPSSVEIEASDMLNRYNSYFKTDINAASLGRRISKYFDNVRHTVNKKKYTYYVRK